MEIRTSAYLLHDYSFFLSILKSHPAMVFPSAWYISLLSTEIKEQANYKNIKEKENDKSI